MRILHDIATQLLLEQNSKIDIIKKAIEERIPLSIYYRGPAHEVREGQRIDIEPVVMGRHIRSGNLVIWAYVFKGVSKRGIPDWKMFRVDRIVSAKLNYNVKNFDLDIIPGYEKGKAPASMKSLSSVDVFSPYWFKAGEKYVAPPEPEIKKVERPEPPQEPEEPDIPQPIIEPIQKPEISSKEFARKIYADLKSKSRNINGQNYISFNDYQNALNQLYHAKEDEFKIYQRAIGGNERPGEGTRKRFTDTSKKEIDTFLHRDNIEITDNINQLAEAYRMINRFERLINW